MNEKKNNNESENTHAHMRINITTIFRTAAAATATAEVPFARAPMKYTKQQKLSIKNMIIINDTKKVAQTQHTLTQKNDRAGD